MHPGAGASGSFFVFGSVSEMWARFDERGQLLNLRFDFPDTEDGPKVVNWQNDKAEVWFKKKGAQGGVRVVREKSLIERLRMNADQFDPRKLMENLFERMRKGQDSLEMNISQGDGPVLVNVIDKKAGGRTVYKVDLGSHLVREIERYGTGEDGQEKLLGRTLYLDYNTPGPEDVFVLHPPEGAWRIDETTQIIGVEKGSLSDKEVAQKAVREFFEALIAKDYAKTGQIFSGSSAAHMEQSFGKINYIQIVSIGEPTPHEPTRSLRVPCEIEREADGKVEIQKLDGPLVRVVHSDPNRFMIHGGI